MKGICEFEMLMESERKVGEKKEMKVNEAERRAWEEDPF